MEIVRDKRAKGIKLLLEKNEIKYLTEIFDDHVFPISIIANHLGTNTTRLRRLIENPGELSFDEAIAIARYFQVKEKLIVDMAFKRAINRK